MTPQPPCPTFASRQLARLMPVDETRSRGAAWATASAGVALILAVQHAAPPTASVILLQLLLTAQAVWFLGSRIGLAVAVATVLAGATLAHFAGAGPRVAAVPPAVQLWNLLSRLVTVAAVAFVLAGLRRALEVERWRASVDHLTGALNRGAFEERLERTLRRGDMQGRALVLAFMDLDGFKGVNDRHGHAAGNRVLAAFARAAVSAIRPGDHFGRVGGDEFAAVLTVPDCMEGDRLAEQLHRRLNLILAGTGFPVTCSMGALVMDARAMRSERELLEQADRLMYIAKAAGKNALHIGRGEVLEEVLRAAFPPVHDVPPAFTALLRWADHADRTARGEAPGG